jgi:8-oxo-dGTP pyrophosphatase MutT (NUDIX family)
MNIICTLSDKELLGKEGTSTTPPRYTSRAIVKRPDGLYALIFTKKFHLYTFPGGGIESGESPLDAVKREILEETGYACTKATELGIICENRAYCNYTQHSYYFFAEANDKYLGSQFTDIEIKNGTSVHWYKLDKVIELINNFKPFTNQQRYLQARDIAALNYYVNNIEKYQ